MESTWGDNDLNPSIETTKYQSNPTPREDDDDVDWYRAEGQHLKRVYKIISNNGSDDIQLSDYISRRYMLPDEDDSEMQEFFEFAFDLPDEKLNQVDMISRDGKWRDNNYSIILAIFKKAGLDGRILMSDEKINQLLA